MKFPEDLLYTEEHQWILHGTDGTPLTIGVTDYFQERMEEIIYIENPPAGSQVEKGEPIFLIESGKTVYEFSSPLQGIIVEVNRKVLATPGLINMDPYGEGWIIRMTVSGSANDSLLTPGEYREFLAGYTYPRPPLI